MLLVGRRAVEQVWRPGRPRDAARRQEREVVGQRPEGAADARRARLRQHRHHVLVGQRDRADAAEPLRRARRGDDLGARPPKGLDHLRFDHLRDPGRVVEDAGRLAGDVDLVADPHRGLVGGGHQQQGALPPGRRPLPAVDDLEDGTIPGGLEHIRPPGEEGLERRPLVLDPPLDARPGVSGLGLRRLLLPSDIRMKCPPRGRDRPGSLDLPARDGDETPAARPRALARRQRRDHVVVGAAEVEEVGRRGEHVRGQQRRRRVGRDAVAAERREGEVGVVPPPGEAREQAAQEVGAGRSSIHGRR